MNVPYNNMRPFNNVDKLWATSERDKPRKDRTKYSISDDLKINFPEHIADRKKWIRVPTGSDFKFGDHAWFGNEVDQINNCVQLAELRTFVVKGAEGEAVMLGDGLWYYASDLERCPRGRDFHEGQEICYYNNLEVVYVIHQVDHDRLRFAQKGDTCVYTDVALKFIPAPNSAVNKIIILQKEPKTMEDFRSYAIEQLKEVAKGLKARIEDECTAHLTIPTRVANLIAGGATDKTNKKELSERGLEYQIKITDAKTALLGQIDKKYTQVEREVVALKDTERGSILTLINSFETMELKWPE